MLEALLALKGDIRPGIKLCPAYRKKVATAFGKVSSEAIAVEGPNMEMEHDKWTIVMNS